MCKMLVLTGMFINSLVTWPCLDWDLAIVSDKIITNFTELLFNGFEGGK